MPLLSSVDHRSTWNRNRSRLRLGVLAVGAVLMPVLPIHAEAEPSVGALMLALDAASVNESFFSGSSTLLSQDEWEMDEEDWDSEEDDLEDLGRSFFYKELVVTGLYSIDGVRMIPPDDMSEDHWEFSPRPPGTYAGFDYVHTFTSASPINAQLPDWLQLAAIDLHPRFLFDRMETGNGLQQIDFAPQDFWARFNLGDVDRLSLSIGQFVLPYGVNPPLAPRQKLILPVEALDLGFKWDWGIGLKGPVGEYDWELAATIGSGESLHSSHLLHVSDRTSFLLTGRIGSPTYWDFQHGLSFLVGDVPVIRASNVMSAQSVSRWRVGYDAFYKYGTYLMLGAQVTFGQDGFWGDDQFVGITMGDTADVLGYRCWVDWVLPMFTDVRLGAQFESVHRDLSTSGLDDTAATLEVSYSLTTEITLTVDYRIEMNHSMGMENNALYFSFVYYGF